MFCRDRQWRSCSFFLFFWLVTTHRKVGHVRDEHVDLDDLCNRRPGLLQHGLQVLDARRRLLLDRALDQRARCVARDLTGAIDGAICLDGLGLAGRAF